MQLTRLLSLLLFAANVALAASVRGPQGGVGMVIVSLVPLAAIWFPESMARASSTWMLHGTVHRESPPGCLVGVAWCALLALLGAIGVAAAS